MKNSLGGLMQQFDSKHIMGSAKDTYENEKTAQELLKSRQKERVHSMVQELKRRTLAKVMWDILEIQINLEDIEDFDIGGDSYGRGSARWVPSALIDNVRFVYDARFKSPYSGHSAELWDERGLKIWGECNKYNGYNFPCGKKGLSKEIQTRRDLGEILSEGVKADHLCRDPWPEW